MVAFVCERSNTASVILSPVCLYIQQFVFHTVEEQMFMLSHSYSSQAVLLCQSNYSVDQKKSSHSVCKSALVSYLIMGSMTVELSNEMMLNLHPFALIC